MRNQKWHSREMAFLQHARSSGTSICAQPWNANLLKTFMEQTRKLENEAGRKSILALTDTETRTRIHTRRERERERVRERTPRQIHHAPKSTAKMLRTLPCNNTITPPT